MDKSLLRVWCLVILLPYVLATSGSPANSTTELRLVGGRYPNEGRVEVRLPGQETWGSFCSVMPEHRHAAGRVMCRQLGYAGLYAISNTAEFGRTTGPISLQDIHCVYPLKPLEECTLETWTPTYDGCDHRHDVGIKCFTGAIRLVGGTAKNDGKVMLHIGGDEWLSLAKFGTDAAGIVSDYICIYLGYPLAVGPTQKKLDDKSQSVICGYGHCVPVSYSTDRTFFDCLDTIQLKMCPDEKKQSTSLLGVVCAKEHEVLPLNESPEFRLSSHDAAGTNVSRHVGFLEGRYNGSDWKTVCIHLECLSNEIGFADRACRYHGYPRAFYWEQIPYTESDYESDGDDLILRLTYLDEKQWMYGQNSCRDHNYSQIVFECDQGATLFGLTVYPCPTQSCFGRCGSPATETQCGCDVLCTLCNDCCHDYSTRCPLQQHNITEEFMLVASLHESLSCVIYDDERAVLVQGCPTDWPDDEVVSCQNDSTSKQIKYTNGSFFDNVYCAICYYNESRIITTMLVVHKCTSDNILTKNNMELGSSSESKHTINENSSDSSYTNYENSSPIDSAESDAENEESSESEHTINEYSSDSSYTNYENSSSIDLAESDAENEESSDMNYASYDLGIGTCSAYNVSLEIQSGCLAYSATVVASDGVQYKNPHCAVCNGVNFSGWYYHCTFSLMCTERLDNIYTLLGREKLSIWVPQKSTDFVLLSDVHCFSKLYLMRIKSSVNLHAAEVKTMTQSQISGMMQCYLLILSQQNVKSTWPFYAAFIEGKMISALDDDTSEVATWGLGNVTDFEALLDDSVLPSYKDGSSNKWVVRCGIGKVEFDEICGLVDDHIEPCGDSLYITNTEMLTAFNFSGIQVVYVGGGLLVEAKWVSYSRSYRYQSNVLNTSAKSTTVKVCGEPFLNEECRTPLVQSTRFVSSGGASMVHYQRKVFPEDHVVYLPDHRILICSSIFTTVDPLEVLSYVFYSVSTVALVATFTTYCVFPVLRNVPGRAIMRLTTAMSTAQLLTLLVTKITEPTAFCVTVAAVLHFLWLSTFAWMNVLAFDLVRTFSSKETGRPSKRVFLGYIAYAWGLPLLIVFACLVIHFIWGQRLGFQYGAGPGEDTCWLSGQHAIVGAFIFPIACSLVANVVMFVWTVRSVHASIVAGAMVRADKSRTKEKVGELWIYLKISAVMGFTWVFGCLANRINHVVLWYLFVILNSLQGVFIFFSFSCNRRIRALWREKLQVAKQPRGATSNAKTQRTSTTPVTSKQSSSV